jgi:hypothetical protein
MAGGIAQHEAFKTAFDTALLYNIACYVVVALVALLLKAPPAHTARPGHARPVVAE